MILITWIYVNLGFNVELGVPVWTSYVISDGPSKKSYNNTTKGKWIEDPRLELNHTGSCERLSNIVRKDEVDYTHLFPAGKQHNFECAKKKIKLKTFTYYQQNFLLKESTLG